jgi:hypothetical protein
MCAPGRVTVPKSSNKRGSRRLAIGVSEKAIGMSRNSLLIKVVFAFR